MTRRIQRAGARGNLGSVFVNLAVLASLLFPTGCATDSGGNSSDVAAPGGESRTSAAERSPDEQKVVEAIERTFKGNPESAPGSSKSATCLATGWVDEFGLEKLKKYGFLKQDLTYDESGFSGKMTPRDARTYLNVEFDCVSYREVVADMVAPDEPKSDPYVVACTRAVTERDARNAFAVALSGGDFQGTSFARKLERAGCGYEGD